MKILLTNDDGYDQPGAVILHDALKETHDTWSVCPSKPSSGSSSSLGLHDSMKLDEQGKQRYSLTGTPTDCVKIALQEILRGNPPDLVISGINPGANLANNTLYSGTVGAATEASLWNIPAMAVSIDLANYPDKPLFGTAVFVIRKLIESGIHKRMPARCVLNVNVPAVPPDDIRTYEWTVLGAFAEDAKFDRLDDGKFSYGAYRQLPLIKWEHTDVEALTRKSVSLTILTSDRTHPVGLETLELPSLLSQT